MLNRGVKHHQVLRTHDKHWVCDWWQECEGHLRLYVSIVVVLEQQGRSFGVIFAGGDVERRKTYFPFSVILQEQRDHLIMTLLQCYSQWREAILHTHTHTYTLGHMTAEEQCFRLIIKSCIIITIAMIINFHLIQWPLKWFYFFKIKRRRRSQLLPWFLMLNNQNAMLFWCSNHFLAQYELFIPVLQTLPATHLHNMLCLSVLVTMV